MGITAFVPEARSALIVVDVQKDFCPGGSLAVKDGDQVVDPLNRFIAQFMKAHQPVIYTRDWHPTDCEHFKKWPVHCVQNTRGAEFHPDLIRVAGGFGTYLISKGNDPIGDAYSGFDGKTDHGQPLEQLLRSLNIETLYVGGLATDYCVKATVIDGCKLGFRVKYIMTASRAVNLQPGDDTKAETAMAMSGAELILG